MTHEEQELITLIRQSEQPEEALAIAVEIITSILTQHESSQEPSASFPPG